MLVDENDYLSILAGLGHECLGTVRIVAKNSPYLHYDEKNNQWYLPVGDAPMKQKQNISD